VQSPRAAATPASLSPRACRGGLGVLLQQWATPLPCSVGCSGRGG